MKRDARIGLAVVLVLGLAVTLLIGKAIYKQGDTADGDNDAPKGGAPTTSEIARGESLPLSGLETAEVRAPIDNTSVPMPNPAVEGFIHDQTRALNLPAAPPVPPAPAPSPHGDKMTPEQLAVADHEMPPPMSGNKVETRAPEFFAYTVSSGDNMWRISSKVYGDGKYTQKIAEANPTLNAKQLKPGTFVKIPTIANKTTLMKLPRMGDDGKPAAPAPEMKSGNVPVEASIPVIKDAAQPAKHRIAAGETLAVIAQKYYGSSGPKSIGRIIDANKGLSPTKLKIGQELTIPAAAK